MRFLLALKCFFLVLFKGRLPEEAAPLLLESKRPILPASTKTEIEVATTQPIAALGKNNDGAVQVLSLFQREGRLLDFLQEEIDSYSDAQIGAAVRDIHRGCRKALAEHFGIEPVLREQENARVRVDAGFDPGRIRLVGNVVGEPPFQGTLKHHGWRTTKVALPTSTATDPTVVAPAEVEL